MSGTNESSTGSNVVNSEDVTIPGQQDSEAKVGTDENVVYLASDKKSKFQNLIGKLKEHQKVVIASTAVFAVATAAFIKFKAAAQQAIENEDTSETVEPDADETSATA